MEQSLDTELRILEARIDLLKQKEHIPAELLELVHAVYARQIKAVAEAKTVLPPDETLAAMDTHHQGAPVLPREEFPLDADQAQGLFEEFLSLLLEKTGPMAEAASVVAKAVANGGPTLADCFAAHLAGNEEFFNDFGKKTPQAPRILAFLIQSAAAPGITAAARALANRHQADNAWSHSHCPVCGSLPLMGELRQKEGFRYVACSFCRTSYRIPRLHCAFCGEQDHTKLSYFTADDEIGYRVEVCETCKLYMKTADFREFDKKILPLLDDLESLSLDILAGNEGYNRPTLSGFGF